MKKIVAVLILFSASISLAQSNEFKADILDVLVLRTVDVAYEYHMNDEGSVGVSVFMNFEPKSSKFRYNEDFQITPYFRQKITNVNVFDVYVEVFGSLNFAETDVNPVTLTKQNYTDFAVGLGSGLKHVSKNGYVFDLNAGVGRNLFNASISRDFVPRLGIMIGKQF